MQHLIVILSSSHLAGHGAKVQVVLLPNGMIGYVCLASSMSGLDNYFSKLFQGLKLPGARNQLPALHANGIFPQLAARCQSPNSHQGRINTDDMASVHQNIDHLFLFTSICLPCSANQSNFIPCSTGSRRCMR
jgi:hypothetical protein